MAKQIINNGDTGLQARTKINDNYTELYDKDTAQDVTIGNNQTAITALDGRVTVNEGDITALDGRITANEADILVLQTPPDAVQLNPVAAPPVYSEGQFYYNSTTGTFNLQGPYPNIEVSPGHGEHVHVVNNSGALIEAGSVVRISGVAGGIPQIVKAVADSFTNASVVGMAVVDIPNLTESAVAVSGIVSGLDTSLLTPGVPYYLSATTPGTLTTTPPAIRTRVGGVLVSDALTGKIRLDIQVNQVSPTVIGRLSGQTVPLYNVTTTPQDIDGYALSKEVVTTVNATTGIITLPNNGEYRATVTASITFPSAITTRTVYFEVYDISGAAVHYTYSKNIPRDATEDSLSFSWDLSELAGTSHKLRIRSSVAIDVTFASISFDITSLSIT